MLDRREDDRTPAERAAATVEEGERDATRLGRRDQR